MGNEEIVRVCAECDEELHESAIEIERGVWWTECSRTLNVNPRLALGEFGQAFLDHLGALGISPSGVSEAITRTARDRLRSAFPRLKPALTVICGQLGLAVGPKKGGAA